MAIMRPMQKPYRMASRLRRISQKLRLSHA